MTRDWRSWRRMLPQYLVVRAGSSAQVAVHVPDGASVDVELELENGGRVALNQLMVWVDPREVDGSLVGEATFEIPDDVEPGYHYLHASSGERKAKAQLIVVPDRLVMPSGRQWGFMLQLYAVRSRASWAMGDLRDLAELVMWSGRDLGADFVLVNPLHAAGCGGADGAVAVLPVEPAVREPDLPAGRGRARGRFGF